MYQVYVKLNEQNLITAINSSAFLSDTSGWVQIDEGEGDKYHHAQGNYLPKPIRTDDWDYRYKLEDGKVVELSEEELETNKLPNVRQEKLAELSQACNQAINAGTQVEVSTGMEAFTYSLDDQANVSEMATAITLGADGYLYHANGGKCRLYNSPDIVTMYVALSTLKTHHLTYHNLLKQYVNSLTTTKEIEAVKYGQDLTGEYLEQYGQLMAQAKVEMDKVIANMQKVSDNEAMD